MSFIRGVAQLVARIRGVAQLVARLLWEQDAAGSNPVTPIKKARTAILTNEYDRLCLVGEVAQVVERRECNSCRDVRFEP